MTKRENLRTEPHRFVVTEACKGEGRSGKTGLVVRFRGVDVSRHGFCCILTGYIGAGDSLALSLGGQKIVFDVAWTESYLGIENMHRVGLVSADPLVALDTLFGELGFIDLTMNKAS